MAIQVIKAIVQGRYGKLKEWEELNPIPRAMELIFVTDMNRFKAGDGERTFKELPYVGTDGRSIQYEIEGDILKIRLQGETEWKKIIAKGPPGDTIIPTVGENGNWFIKNQDTGLPSRGLKGDKGEATKITLSEDGYWELDGVKSKVLARSQPTELVTYVNGKKHNWRLGVINDDLVVTIKEAENG